MDVFLGHAGWIEVICGPMFSGRSEELIRRLRRAMIARKRVQVFKPSIDDRYSRDEIVSHGDMRMQPEVVQGCEEIRAKLDCRTHVVGVDEANFFGAGLIDIANQLADSGKQVIVAGLDTDYSWTAFSANSQPSCHGGVHYQNTRHLYALRKSWKTYATSCRIR